MQAFNAKENTTVSLYLNLGPAIRSPGNDFRFSSTGLKSKRRTVTGLV